MSETSQDVIITETVDDHVRLITINRPEARNSFDRATAVALEAAMDAYEADPDARVAIITGRGPTFSAGQDLKAAARGEFGTSDRRGGFGVMGLRPSKPLIAAVEGQALAGGFELCLACDLIVASTASIMGLPESARALVAMGGGLFRLPKRIPYHIAMELALTGEPRPAAFFAQWGLVNRLAEPGQVVDTARELARSIASSGPLAVTASLEIIRRSYDWEDAESWQLQKEFSEPAIASEDTQEGIRAFIEKREPVWRGR